MKRRIEVSRITTLAALAILLAIPSAVVALSNNERSQRPSDQEIAGMADTVVRNGDAGALERSVSRESPHLLRTVAESRLGSAPPILEGCTADQVQLRYALPNRHQLSGAYLSPLVAPGKGDFARGIAVCGGDERYVQGFEAFKVLLDGEPGWAIFFIPDVD